MYRLINEVIKELVINKFGEEVWMTVKEECERETGSFYDHEYYDDVVTCKIAASTSEIVGIPKEEILLAFGEFVVTKLFQEKYGKLLKAGGKNLREFLLNLPNFHSQLMLLFPEITPAEFKISDVNKNSLQIHFYFIRSGLTYFIIGLLKGLSKIHNEITEVKLLDSKKKGHAHDVFSVNW